MVWTRLFGETSDYFLLYLWTCAKWDNIGLTHYQTLTHSDSLVTLSLICHLTSHSQLQVVLPHCNDCYISSQDKYRPEREGNGKFSLSVSLSVILYSKGSALLPVFEQPQGCYSKSRRHLSSDITSLKTLTGPSNKEREDIKCQI